MKPFFKSKKHYHKRLDEGVEELSELQRLHYACNRYPITSKEASRHDER